MIDANKHFGLSKQPVKYHAEKNGYDLAYSDGVRQMIEQYNAQWIITFVAANKPTKFNKAGFHQFLIDRVHRDKFSISMVSGSRGVYCITGIIDAVLPCDCMSLWLTNSLLMFPSEYEFTD